MKCDGNHAMPACNDLQCWQNNGHAHHECGECAALLVEVHAMLTEIKAFLDPLKALAGGLGPMAKVGMSPNARAAAARIKELSV